MLEFSQALLESYYIKYRVLLQGNRFKKKDGVHFKFWKRVKINEGYKRRGLPKKDGSISQ